MNNFSEILLNIIFQKYVSVSHGLYKQQNSQNMQNYYKQQNSQNMQNCYNKFFFRIF